MFVEKCLFENTLESHCKHLCTLISIDEQSNTVGRKLHSVTIFHSG